MEIYKVTKKDLIGGIEGFPVEVVQKMVERQFEYRGYCDVKVLQAHKTGGFGWTETPEDYDFWYEVILNKNFDLFFDRYPKQDLPLPRMVLVWDNDESLAEERELLHVFPESSGLAFRYIVRSPSHTGYVISYRHIKELPDPKKMTKAEIEKELGYEIEIINNK